MKKIKILFLTLLVFALLVACGDGEEEKLIRSWQMTNFEVDDTITTEQKELVKTAKFTYNKDYSLNAEIGGNKLSGEWGLSDDGKVLSHTVEGKIDILDITHLSTTELVYEGSRADGKAITFYFKSISNSN